MPDQKYEGTITAFPVESLQAQDHDKTGSELNMAPQPIVDQLEDWDENGKPFLRPYKGSEKLKNKSALITGGDSGIGRAVAVQFAHEG